MAESKRNNGKKLAQPFTQLLTLQSLVQLFTGKHHRMDNFRVVEEPCRNEKPGSCQLPVPSFHIVIKPRVEQSGRGEKLFGMRVKIIKKE